MKLRWWLVACAAATAGVVFVLRSVIGRDRPLHFTDDDRGEKNFNAFPPDIPQTEFEGIDFFS